MKKTFSLLALGLCAVTTHAQPAALDAADAAQTRRQLRATGAPAESYDGETDDLGVQTLLAPTARRHWFTVSGDVQYFYNDNLFNARERHATDVLVSTVEGAFAPDAYTVGGGQLAPRLGCRDEWYNYASLLDDNIRVVDPVSGVVSHPSVSAFDFMAKTLFADVAWTRNNWTLAAGYDFRWLVSQHSDNEFYREHVPHWGVQRWLPLDARSGLALAYQGDWRITHARQFTPSFPGAPVPRADENDRTDHSLIASYSHKVGARGELTPYYRFQFTEFLGSVDRRDTLHTLGLAFAWQLCPRSSVRLFASYDWRESSNASIGSYEKFNGGVGANLTFRF
jgi:hypothetical protein